MHRCVLAAKPLVQAIQLLPYRLPQYVLNRSISGLTADVRNDNNTEHKKPRRSVKKLSSLSEALSIVKLLKPKELTKLAKKVASLRKELPMDLPFCPTNLKGKFVIYDKEFSDPSHKFNHYVETVHSYKLVWRNGDVMDLKIANSTGFIAAGTTMYEIQGLQVGPLLITAAFPNSHRLPSNSSAMELEEGVIELVEVCKQHKVKFKDAEDFTSFVDWLMQTVMTDNTRFLYNIVEGGPLAEAYDNCLDQEDEEIEEG